MWPFVKKNWRTLILSVLGAIGGDIIIRLLTSSQLRYQWIGGAILVLGMLVVSFWMITTGEPKRKRKKPKRR